MNVWCVVCRCTILLSKMQRQITQQHTLWQTVHVSRKVMHCCMCTILTWHCSRMHIACAQHVHVQHSVIDGQRSLSDMVQCERERAQGSRRCPHSFAWPEQMLLPIAPYSSVVVHIHTTPMSMYRRSQRMWALHTAQCSQALNIPAYHTACVVHLLMQHKERALIVIMAVAVVVRYVIWRRCVVRVHERAYNVGCRTYTSIVTIQHFIAIFRK